LTNHPQGLVLLMTRWRAHKYELLLVVAAIIWGATFPAQQIGMQKGLGPMTYNALRFSLGALCLLPVLYWRKNVLKIHYQGALPIKGAIVAGLFFSAGAGTQQIGLQFTSSANAGFITTLYILFVPLIGLLLGQKAARSLWPGVITCLIGLYLLSSDGPLSLSKGDWWILLCALCWAGQILAVDRVARQGDPVMIALIQYLVCIVVSGTVAILLETLTIHALRAGSGAVAFAGIMSVGIAFTLQVICQKHCAPGPTAVIMSLEAVFAALTGYLILDQLLSVRGIIGCGLILIGVLFAQLSPLRKPSGSTPAAARG
jgi:drug/metabolite transporter (DMT)-like permease